MADVWLTFGISAGTPSIPNNTTPVTVTVYANWRYGYYNKNNKSGTLTIDGTPYPFAAPFNTGVSSSGSCTLYSKSVNVKHNDKGAKTLSVSASYVTGVVGTVTASTSKKLTTIPRVSDLEVDIEIVPADGTSQVIAIATKKATSFTDILTVTLGDYSQEIESGVAFSIPMEWINAISGTSAKATVKVETFSDSTSIGTKTAELTITVPESVVPVINDVGITEAVAAVTNAFGNRFVQNLSQLNVDVDASGVYGSTIRSYSTSLDGVNYIQQAFTSNVLKTAGTLDVAVKVTDSRGRTAEETVTVNIVEYVKPTITSMVYIHCDSDGTQNSSGECTKVTIAGKVYSVDGQNTKALKLKYKSTAEEVYTERVVTISDWTFSVDVVINNTDPTVTYEYVAELTDKINAGTPETFKVTTGVPVLSRLAGGGGVTFFKEAKKEGLNVKDMRLDPTKEELEALSLLGGAEKLIDWIYPIGAVIASTNPAFNPNAIYTHQTWERFAQGKTLVGVDESDEDFASAGLELGEKEHELTTDEMPEHRHGLNGVAVSRNTSGYVAARSYTFSSLDDVGHTGYAGKSVAHNNIQPSVTVYYWRRIPTGDSPEEPSRLIATHDGLGNVTAYGITATHDGAGNVRIL